MQRKLSEIFIEIARQGLKSPNYGNSEVMHPLMMLAHIAWRRETSEPDFMKDEYEKHFKVFKLSKEKIKRQLVSTDWEEILNKMREYKRLKFSDDNRIVTLCAYTPRKTLRVEWKDV